MNKSFNFKSWLSVTAKKSKKKSLGDLDSIIEQRLRNNSDSEEPQTTTQQQLESSRKGEPNSIFEDQLEKVRKGASLELTEGSLESSSSTLHKHRNPDASKGHINKLEEQRRAGSDIPEKTKYEPASETPWKQQFWHAKSPDGLKLASTKKKIASQGWGVWDGDDDDVSYDTVGRSPAEISSEDWIPGGSEIEDLDSGLMSTIEDINRPEAKGDTPEDILDELVDSSEEFEVLPAAEVTGAATQSTGAEAAGLTPMVIKIPPTQLEQFRDESGQINKNKFIGRAVGFLTMNPEYAPPEVSSSIFSENLIDQGILMYMLPSYEKK